MDRKGSLAVILLVFIVSKASDASLIGNFRRMVGLATEANPNITQISPSPSPIPSRTSDQLDNPTKKNPINSINETSEKSHAKNKANEDLNHEGTDENCPRWSKRCTGQYQMAACLKHHKNGSMGLFILVQNEGETTLKVNVTATSATISVKELEIPKQQARKINASVNVGGKNPEVVLNAGNGVCAIHIGLLPSEGKIFQWIPIYANQLTPVYGAYLMLLVVLIVGGMWACCKFGKGGRRTDGGIPYRELEMGLPGSGSANNVEVAADGWDQVWDDNWDEEGAVKSPGGQRARNVSANGLTSRSPTREGWENGWDE